MITPTLTFGRDRKHQTKAAKGQLMVWRPGGRLILTFSNEKASHKWRDPNPIPDCQESIHESSIKVFNARVTYDGNTQDSSGQKDHLRTIADHDGFV